MSCVSIFYHLAIFLSFRLKNKNGYNCTFLWDIMDKKIMFFLYKSGSTTLSQPKKLLFTHRFTSSISYIHKGVIYLLCLPTILTSAAPSILLKCTLYQIRSQKHLIFFFSPSP